MVITIKSLKYCDAGYILIYLINFFHIIIKFISYIKIVSVMKVLKYIMTLKMWRKLETKFKLDLFIYAYFCAH